MRKWPCKRTDAVALVDRVHIEESHTWFTLLTILALSIPDCIDVCHGFVKKTKPLSTGLCTVNSACEVTHGLLHRISPLLGLNQRNEPDKE